jgi:hypothetical protein
VKYMLLLNNDARNVESRQQLSDGDKKALRAEEIPRWNELFAWIGEQGLEVDGLELDDPAGARVIRVRDDETIVSDGPFAETKEILGGYFLADCRDLDQAIELAERVPVAAKGSVEIRPLVDQ